MEIEADHPGGVLERLVIEGTEWELRRLCLCVLEAASEGEADVALEGTDAQIVIRRVE